jgi:hypothetical protein
LTLHRAWVGALPKVIKAGQQITATVSLMNLPATVTWTIDEYTAPTRTRFSGTALAGTQIDITLAVAPAAEGSAVTVSATVEGQLVNGPLGAVLETQAGAEVDASLVRLAELIG